jgi:effector-binding domain-containing protein
MINKDNTLRQNKNNGFTPEAISKALESLPHNFVVLASKLLEEWQAEGKIEKTYSKVYISRVKTGDKGAFNEDIMNALVEVGTKNKEIKEKYGRITKKTSQSN